MMARGRFALRRAHLARRIGRELPPLVGPQGREHRGAETGNAAVGARRAPRDSPRARAAEQEDPRRDDTGSPQPGRGEEGLNASAEPDAGAVDRSESAMTPIAAVARTKLKGSDAKHMQHRGVQPLMTQGVNVGDENRHGSPVAATGRTPSTKALHANRNPGISRRRVAGRTYPPRQRGNSAAELGKTQGSRSMAKDARHHHAGEPSVGVHA